MAGTATVMRTPPASSGLYDVLDLILDKGLVIDAYVRVSLVGIELLTVDLRVVVASVDTYLRFAEAVDRMNLRGQSAAMGLQDLRRGRGGDGGGMLGGGGVTGMLSRGLHKAEEALTDEGEEEQESEEAEEQEEE